MRNIKLTETEFRFLCNSLRGGEEYAVKGFKLDCSSKSEFHRKKLFQEQLTDKIRSTKKEGNE